MTRRRLLRVAIVTVLFAPVFALGRGASGVSVTDFSGWDMGGKATSVAFIFDSPSLGIPAKPTGEMNCAYSETMLQSGPAAYGLGSSMWPGQVAAALPPFLQNTIEANSSANGGPSDIFPTDVPAYPIRAESFFPQGPTTATFDAGSIHMRSSAKETTAEGISHMSSFGMPFFGSSGNQSSFAQSGFDTQGAVSMVEAAANDLSFIAGLIHIDSVVTRATARSDGVKGTVAGGTTVSGARITGVGDVIVDENGVRVADQGLGAAAQQQALNQVINEFGISMHLSEPIDTVSGPKASRSLGGLVISAKSNTMEPLLVALPQQVQTEVRGQLTLDQTFSIQVGPAAVTAGAVKNIEFPLPSTPASGPTGGSSGGNPGGGVDVGSSGGTPTTSTTGGGATGGGTTVVGGGEPTGLNLAFDGLPLWLLFGVLILVFTVSRPLTMWADRVLAARIGAVACPLEDT